MDYQYTSPVDKGYHQLRIPKRELIALGVRPRHRFGAGSMTIYYHPEYGFHIEHTTNTWGKVLATTMLPLVLVIYGLSGVKEHVQELKRIFNEREHGAFTTDSIQEGNMLFSPLSNLAQRYSDV